MTGGQITIVIVAAVLVFWIIGAYNRLVALRNAIGAAWAQVDDQLQRRHASLQALADALQPLWSEEPDAPEAVRGALLQVRAAADAMRAGPVAAGVVQSLVTAERVLGSALAQLLALLEHHPDWRDELPPVAEGLRALPELDQRLDFARQLYNEAAKAYNEAARQFPTRLLTRLFGFGTAGRL